MFTIALVNQKGGVGKSTTAVNLSAGLARLGKRVLLIDLDPQAHSTVSMGLQPKKLTHTVYTLLSGAARVHDVIHKVSDGLSIIPASIDLAGGEAELASQPNPQFILKHAMAELGDAEYDYAIVDSPPQLGFLNVNNLAWVREVFIPLTCEFYALHGLSLLLETVERIQAKLNPSLQVSGVIACQYNPRRALTKDVLADLEEHFPGKVMKTKIRVNVRLAESPSHGMSIFDYAPDSNGATDYMNLAKELLERPMPAALPQEVVVVVRPAPEPVVEQAIVAEAPAPELEVARATEEIVTEAPAQEPVAAPITEEAVAEAPAAVEEPVAATEPEVIVDAVAPAPEVSPAAEEIVAEAPAQEPEAAPVAEEVVAEAPAPEPEVAPAVSSVADEVVAEAIRASEVPAATQEAAAEAAPAVHDPYSEAEPVAAKSDFVSPLPPTPISELKTAPLPAPSRPPMAGRYAMAGLKPIVVARPAGSAPPPAPEKKKGMFVNRLFNRFLAKKD